MPEHAKGPFTVQTTPAPSEAGADASLGRMILTKQFHGDLEATSQGQMLTAGTAIPSSAVYVAIEHVTGTLHGRSGSFALYHNGIMTRGAPQLAITVVPDSGTDQLTGLSGTMTITIENGDHGYDFTYTLDETG